MKTKACVLLLSLILLLSPLLVSASNFYIFPESDRKHLSYEEVWAWQYDALSYAFNELFARYGRPFNAGSKYDNYFQCQTWYKVDPNYPGDGYVLSNLEWDNYKLIKQVREEMRSLGTKNLDGKPLPPVFDDEIFELLSGFKEAYFQPNQSLPVFDGPGAHYRRGAGGKAAVGTNGRVYVAGWEAGWLMVMYQLSKGGVRVGFVNPANIKNTTVIAPQLAFENVITKTVSAATLTEDPLMTLNTVAQLPAGASVVWLTRYHTATGIWDYVETTVNGQVCRGFLPQGVTDLGWFIDSPINK